MKCCDPALSCHARLQVAPYSVQVHVHNQEHNFSNVAAVHGRISHAVVHFFGGSALGEPNQR